MFSFDNSRAIAYKSGLCEWDPVTDSTAMSLRDKYVGCGNDATVATGTANRNNCHLRESCADLKRFARFKKRPLKTPREVLNGK